MAIIDIDPAWLRQLDEGLTTIDHALKLAADDAQKLQHAEGQELLDCYIRLVSWISLARAGLRLAQLPWIEDARQQSLL